MSTRLSPCLVCGKPSGGARCPEHAVPRRGWSHQRASRQVRLEGESHRRSYRLTRACVYGRLSPQLPCPAGGGPEVQRGDSLGLVARCQDGNSDKTRSPPRDRVRSEDPDLVGIRTGASEVIDGRLQRAARIPSRQRTAARVNLEFTGGLGCPWSVTSHAFSRFPAESRPSAHHRRVGQAPLSRQGSCCESPVTSIHG